MLAQIVGTLIVLAGIVGLIGMALTLLGVLRGPAARRMLIANGHAWTARGILATLGAFEGGFASTLVLRDWPSGAWIAYGAALGLGVAQFLLWLPVRRPQPTFLDRMVMRWTRRG